jgi:nucleotide-binding universal stress UspA family protein
MLPLHTILCPLDFSERSYKGLDAAIELATHFQAELILVHVVPVAIPGIPRAADTGYGPASPGQYDEELRVVAEEQFSRVAQRIPSGIKLRRIMGNGALRRNSMSANQA